MKTRSLSSALLGAALLWAPVVAPAQDDVRHHGIFIDSIDVQLVNIQVMAVDKDGNPVTDLTRDDFEVYEDGQPVTLTNFFAVEDGVRREPGMGEAIEPVPEESPDRAPAPASPFVIDDSRYVVLFVDNTNISPNHRKRVFTELRKDLAQLMEPADRVMVARLDREVHVEQPFTRDRSLIEQALESLEETAPAASMRRAEESRVLTLLQSSNSVGPGSGGTFGQDAGPFNPGMTPEEEARMVLQNIQSYVQQVSNDTQTSLNALERFVSSLAGLQGRKAVVYVSDGLEIRPGEFLLRNWESKYGAFANDVGIGSVDFEIDRYSLEPRFRDLVAEANANRVAFYTIEGGNQRGGGTVSAQTRTFVANPVARTAEDGRQTSLRSLAFETGGTALIDSSNVGALLSRLEQDFSHYYSLGYPSPHPGDGKYHEVKVRVRRPGVELRYLEGYRAKTPDERMTDRTLASLLFDTGTNPLDVKVELGELQAENKNRFVVPVMVKIPLSKLVLVPQQNAHLGQVSVFIAVRDASGRMSDPQKIDVPVTIPNDQLLNAMTRTAGYMAQLRMRPGSQKIAIGVRDELAAVDSTLNLNVDVGR